MQERRGFSSYSASSNDTILEACSSSPLIHTPGLADGSFPLDPSVAPLPPSFTFGKQSPAKIGDGDRDSIVKGKTVPTEKEQEMEGAKADGEDDAEESIDWDAGSAEDTVNNPSQPRQAVKQAKLPQTMGFHLDWWIARIATAAKNLDFKVLCASMMLWREKNEVLQIPSDRIRHTPRTPWEEDSTVRNSALSQMTRSPSLAPLPLRRADRSSASMLNWDVLLGDIRLASEQMHHDRKWRMRGRKNAAGWCKWGARQRIGHRGEFVEEPEVGYELGREDDGRTWVIRLGYRRNDAVVEDMDLDGEMADADDTVIGERGVGGEEDVQGSSLNTLASNNCHGLDVATEGAANP